MLSMKRSWLQVVLITKTHVRTRWKWPREPQKSGDTGTDWCHIWKPFEKFEGELLVLMSDIQKLSLPLTRSNRLSVLGRAQRSCCRRTSWRGNLWRTYGRLITFSLKPENRNVRQSAGVLSEAPAKPHTHTRTHTHISKHFSFVRTFVDIIY